MLQKIALVFLFSTVFGLPALAQGRFEIQPFVGYKFGGNVPASGINPLSIAKVNVNSSIAAGLTAGVDLDHFGLEFVWNRQPTEAVGILVDGGQFPRRISINVDQFQGNLLLQAGSEDSQLRPFLLFGLGATRASGAGSSDTGFSYALGGGVKYFFTEHMGVRLQARYAPTYLYSTATGTWCNWWGFCWLVGNDHYLHQGDVTAGWIIRF